MCEWDDQEPDEEPAPERKPVCTFVKRQTLLVQTHDGQCAEYPVGGDECHTKATFRWATINSGMVYGYILQRRPKFAHKFYGWGLTRIEA